MELQELNLYLSKLDGPGVIEHVLVTEHSEGGELRVKFCGDTDTIDDGEIEICFHCVDIINLPLSTLMAPVSIYEASQPELNKIINVNYQEDGYNLFIIKDYVDMEWYIYAKSFTTRRLGSKTQQHMIKKVKT
jgi:hypothetical protein